MHFCEQLVLRLAPGKAVDLSHMGGKLRVEELLDDGMLLTVAISDEHDAHVKTEKSVQPKETKIKESEHPQDRRLLAAGRGCAVDSGPCGRGNFGRIRAAAPR